MHVLASNCAMPRVYTVGRLFLFLIFNDEFGATASCQRIQLLCFQWSLVHWSQSGFSPVFSSWTLDSKLTVSGPMATPEPPTRVDRCSQVLASESLGMENRRTPCERVSDKTDVVVG